MSAPLRAELRGPRVTSSWIISIPRFAACLGFLGSSDNSSMLKPSDGINSLLISCRPGDMKEGARDREKLNWSSSFFFKT